GYSLSDYERGEPLPFDLAKAHELYRDLFGGIEDLIQDKHLLVVPSGPLTKLPLHVLVTAEPPMGDRSGAADYSTVPWLVRRQPITILPSVTALKGLRTAATAQQPTRSFIGFGNPLLSGPDGQDRRAWQFQTCPHLASPQPAFASSSPAPCSIFLCSRRYSVAAWPTSVSCGGKCLCPRPPTSCV
ncbi:MAG: CHAT domain-containing protein, partial [Hyphomicrobiaceae bacterium]